MRKALLVLPVHNEEILLAENVRKLHAWCVARLDGWDWRLHVAENGSTDRTAEVARALSAELDRVEASDSPEGGRGRTLSRVWSAAADGYDVLAYMDIDLSSDLEALPALLDAASEGRAVAYGSRFEPGSEVTRSPLRETTSRGYRFLARAALGIRAKDVQCGFKAASSEAWRELAPEVTHPGWFWDTELILWAERLGMRVTPIPVVWVETRDERRKSTVRLVPTVLGYLRDVLVMRRRLAAYRKGSR